MPWASTHLTHVIKTVLAAALNTTITILIWRHAAIAMSFKHLPEEYHFKRDYGLKEGDAIMDLQATHSSKRASASYARGRDEGPGFTRLVRNEYRQLSRHWHVFLGYGTSLPPRDATWAPLEKVADAEPKTNSTKRKRQELEDEVRSLVRGQRLLRSQRTREKPARTPFDDDDAAWEF